jgi:hypothetical protein
MAKNRNKNPPRKLAEVKKVDAPKKLVADKGTRFMNDELMATKPEIPEIKVETPEPEPLRSEAPQQAPKTEAKRGVKMSDKINGEKMYDSVSKLSESFNLEGVKKAAAWYIDTSEKFANQAIEMQEKATTWAKDTPLAPIFEAQHTIAKKMLERSVSVARNLWQIHG